MNLLFVCTGNTCRSAMCEGIFKSLVENNSIKVFSAGINAYDGDAPSENAVKALFNMGIDISNHKAKLLTKDDISGADLVLCMTNMHSSLIKNACPNEKHKIFTLSEYARGTNEEISDPYGLDVDAYEKCALLLKNLLEIVLEKVTIND